MHLFRYCLLLSALALPVVAHAHVKWFVNYDTRNPHRPVAELLTDLNFLGLFAASVLVMAVVLLIDERISPVNRIVALQHRLAPYASRVVRVGSAAFFIVLGVFFPTTLLTPELIVDGESLRFMHLAIGVTALFSVSGYVAASGLIVLYIAAIYSFGLFHMLDYVLFIGLAAFLTMESTFKGRKRALAFHVLRLGICFSLLWSSWEKFTQPDLFYQLIAGHPYLTMGFEQEFFVVSSGIVEFCCAYLLFAGRTAAVVAALVLEGLFAMAIIPFGMVDAVGHMLFMIPIAAITMYPPRHRTRHGVARGTLQYVLVFALFFAMVYAVYYLLHVF